MEKINFSVNKTVKPPPKRRRLFINRKSGAKERLEIVKWAATNGCDAMVVPLGEKISDKTDYIKLAKRYELLIEAGGCDFHLLLPRRLFLFNSDLFRMDQGKRNPKPHFCPTNPKTLSLIYENAGKLFSGYQSLVSPPRIFHLFPEKGLENIWCACPACRAFSAAEQNLLAVNSAADALANIDPDAWLSYLDLTKEPEISQSHNIGVKPRKNVFAIPSETRR